MTMKNNELKLENFMIGYINIKPPQVIRLNLQTIYLILRFSDLAWNIINNTLNSKLVNNKHNKKKQA